MNKMFWIACLLCLVVFLPPPSAWAQSQRLMNMDAQSAHIKSEHRLPTIFPDAEGEKAEDVMPEVQSGEFDALKPFGFQLFTGRFKDTYYDEMNPEYIIMPGDRIGVRIWGAFDFDQVLVVDSLGNIFIPTVGPVEVAGKSNAQLESTVRERVRSVYTQDFEAYVTLLNTQPTAVYVTGFVDSPGRYAGGFSESVLYYLDQAGGIDPKRGSYREIQVLRDGQRIAGIDLYDFILEGTLPVPMLKEGDTIMVPAKGAQIAVAGEVRNQAKFEFSSPEIPGRKILDLAEVKPGASHVSIEGVRDGAPFYKFLDTSDFASFMLKNEDKVGFYEDMPAEVIPVEAKGPVEGESRFLVPKGARLKDVLHYIPVDPELSNLDGIYIKRQSVAERQKEALNNALDRLEQNALTATSASVEESEIRTKEAELIQDFVKRAKQVEPEGVVVVSSGQDIKNVLLEQDDRIVIPQKDDLIMVSGEVVMPQAIVFDKSKRISDYIDGAGGFSERADKGNILVIKTNGEIIPHGKGRLEPGDMIIVLPGYDTKVLQLAKDVSQIMYQLAIAARTAFPEIFSSTGY